MFWLNSKVEKNIIFIKDQEKKLKIKIVRIVLKNIISLI